MNVNVTVQLDKNYFDGLLKLHKQCKTAKTQNILKQNRINNYPASIYS